jgi:hypothetical protein
MQYLEVLIYMRGTVSWTKIYSKFSLQAGDLLKPRVPIYVYCKVRRGTSEHRSSLKLDQTTSNRLGLKLGSLDRHWSSGWTTGYD